MIHRQRERLLLCSDRQPIQKSCCFLEAKVLMAFMHHSSTIYLSTILRGMTGKIIGMTEARLATMMANVNFVVEEMRYESQ